jgi:hypothetical protein
MDDEQITAWLTAVEQQLGLDDSTDRSELLQPVDELGELVGSAVDPAATAKTLFLLGVAAGRSAELPVAANDFAGKLTSLAQGWDADTERA